MSKHKHGGPARSQAAAHPVSSERRQRMIAEAAYYLAEHRGFQGGDTVQDWLQAEGEIARRLGEAAPH